ncbi:putative bifunctional diguanylate cyclase/phosphodiesterase [Arenimonas sp.]|uniref:putative bifunctional diguanylate cyclase/phosphodiesterase n=1 Tax=Arenimonas sp. TaxID=1872635 RepID=UPI0035B23F34
MPAFPRRMLVVLVLLALYVAGGAYSSLLRGGPDEVALFWPAAGVGLAGVLRYGLRVAWFVPLGTLLVHLVFEPVPHGFIPWSMSSNLLGVLAGAWLMRRQPLDDLLTVRFGLHALGGSLVMATVSALVGTAGMLQTEMISLGQVPASAGRWLLGDLLGATSIAPAVMLLLPGRQDQRRRFPDSDYASEAERLAWNIALMASYLLMAWGGSLGGNYALGLVALPLGVMVWSAVRLPPRFTAIASAMTMLLIAGLAGYGTAGYPRAADPLDSLYLLVFLVEVAALPMMLAFAMHQQRVAAGVLKHRANTDPLTGMENRNAFEEGMRPVLAQTSTVPMALAYLDLDHLKLINDTASHAAGDQLIRGVAGVVAAHMHPQDRVARTGGDEFALLLDNCTPMVAEDRMRSLLRAIEGYRCGWNGQMLGTTASVGIVSFLPGQADYAQLLSQADAACFTAKEQGGNRVCVASLDAGELLDRTAAMRWVVRIREALEKNTLALYCQSIVPLQPGVQAGRHFEVLLRLHDPRTGERLEPAQFMPAAERFRLGTRIDREVISQTLGWLESHPEAAATVESCCINLSGEAVIDEGFIGFVAERLRRSSFPAAHLCFELTETSAVRDLARAQRFINQLRELGCRFALDDFGTGFCSFNYLRSLDVDYFKIDGSFVRDMHQSPMAEAVVRSINEIAHVLDKKSIAEHTETEAQRQALQALGVDFGQGFAFDEPKPIDLYFGLGETAKP